MASEVEASTFPQLLIQNSKQRGARPAMREKRRGIWHTTSWNDLSDQVSALAVALAAQGLQRGAHVALVGDNRPRLYAAICAAQWLGAIAVPLSLDATADELALPIQSLGVTHVFAENQEQVDKLLILLPRCPSIRCIVYDNDRGMRHYKQPQLLSYAALLAQGDEAAAGKRDFLQGELAKGTGQDLAFVFASSTDATPGNSFTYAALIQRARALAASDGLQDSDVSVACLPPSWVGQVLFGYAQPMVVGNCIACPESSDTLLADMREMGPTYFLATPGVLRSMLVSVKSRIEDAGKFKRGLYQRYVAALTTHSSGIGNLLMSAPLRDVLGVSRLRAAYVSAAMDAEVQAFFRTIGVSVKLLPASAAGIPIELKGTGQGGAGDVIVSAAPASVRGFAIGAPILELNAISLRFGGVNALTNISFDVREHEVLAIIGPNGAGKSSMLNVINGVYHPQEGSITFRGERMNNMKPTLAARLGISRTFQNIALFKGMSVLDNIMAGRTLKMNANFIEVALQLPRARREESEHREKVEEIIEFLEIEHIRKTPVARLPYGLQKRVELARALAAEPKVLLLDEPMAGMNIEEKQDMCRFILDVNDHYGTTVVLIEHDMGVVMDISDRVVVLDYGKKIGDGTPAEVRANQDVINAYLGVAH